MIRAVAAEEGSTPGRVVKALVRAGLREAVPAAPEVVLRPEGSAGSAGPVPPAGAAAAGDAPSSAVAPAARVVKLERAVAGALAARFGQRDGLLAMARRDIRAGKVRVDGVVCIDPERLVDPSVVGG